MFASPGERRAPLSLPDLRPLGRRTRPRGGAAASRSGPSGRRRRRRDAERMVFRGDVGVIGDNEPTGLRVVVLDGTQRGRRQPFHFHPGHVEEVGLVGACALGGREIWIADGRTMSGAGLSTVPAPPIPSRPPRLGAPMSPLPPTGSRTPRGGVEFQQSLHRVAAANRRLRRPHG